MRHLLVPAHIKWEYTLKNYQRETQSERERVGQDKVGGTYRLTQSPTMREQNKKKDENKQKGKKKNSEGSHFSSSP